MPKKQTKDARSPESLLRTAIDKGDVAAVRSLLDQGIALDGELPRSQDQTALDYAVAREQGSIAAMLLDAGAKPRKRKGQNILIAAARLCDLGLLRRLVELGADINQADRFGNTPLIACAGAAFRDGAEFFLARGAAVDGRNDEGETVFDVAKQTHDYFQSGIKDAGDWGTFCRASSAAVEEILRLLKSHVPPNEHPAARRPEDSRHLGAPAPEMPSATFLDFAKENTEGWSLVAVRTSLDEVAPLIQSDEFALGYQADVQLGVITKDADGLSYDGDGNLVALKPAWDRRTCFVVHPRDSDWCVLFRTIYWVQLEDFEWVRTAAHLCSSRLSTTAVACCGGDHGILCQVYEAGTLSKTVEGFDRKKVAKIFDNLQIAVPRCFIGGDPLNLLATQGVINQIERADRVEFRVQTLHPKQTKR